MKTLCLLIAFLLAGWVAPANAQTTQPAPAGWETTVQAVAKGLTSAGDNDAYQRLLANECIVRSFGTHAKQLDDVIAHTDGAMLLMAKAYLYPGAPIAADIGAAISDSEVTDEVKKLLVPTDADATARANTIASQWAQSALGLGKSEPFAVLVYYIRDVTRVESPDERILFVMLKGRKDRSGAYLVSQIIYGDSQQAALAAAR